MDLEETREMLPGLEEEGKAVRVHPAPEKGLRWRWVSFSISSLFLSG